MLIVTKVRKKVQTIGIGNYVDIQGEVFNTSKYFHNKLYKKMF